MALIQKLKTALWGSTQERMYRYNCRECDTQFEAAETSLSMVECPSCGTDESRLITRL